MTDAQIPLHAHTAFGRKFFAAPNAVEIVDAVSLIYNTGPINVVGADFRNGLVTGDQYQIHRSPTSYYFDHEPEKTFFPTPSESNLIWTNTLTFDKKTADGTSAFTWSFAPGHPPNSVNAGFGYLGPKRLTAEDFAWVVMVR